jgi:Tol biopolymer transport system component
MPLNSNTRLGPYQIVSTIGAGGMGEVYRAHDTKLNRDVAIKVLPDLFAADLDRLARFEREAHVLASLNHPNIAQIYGVEESSGTRALVMELVDGRTLDELTPTLDIGDVVSIARQIAEALEAAHEQGIVHRDLKPANVKVRSDGTVKVLDFGLAKAFDVAAASGDAMNSPTLTVNATQMGVVIGTAAYMAPEQARGKAVDKRADVWAFGAVLYEMLARARPFDGETISDTIAAVLTKDPDWSKVPPDAPAFLIGLAQRCLRKDPRRRPQSIGDVRLALEEGSTDQGVTSAPAVVRPAGWKRWAIAALLLVVGGAAGFAISWMLKPQPLRVPRTVPMQIAENVTLALEEAPAFALSRDGSTIAFVGGAGNSRKLFTRRIDTVTAAPIAGTEGASSPFFSPDGQWLAFIANESLKKVRTSGVSPPVRLTAATDRGGVWLDDDTIIYAPDRAGPLFRISAGGGQPVTVTQAGNKLPTAHRFPTWIPEKPAVLFTARDEIDAIPMILAVDLNAGTQTTLMTGAYHPLYVAPGRLLFMRDSALYSTGFDVDRLRVIGPEIRITDAVRASVEVMAGHFAASGASLLYQSGTLSTALDLAEVVWRDTTGEERPLLTEPATYRDLRFSPDGTRLAYAMLPGRAATDLWVFDRIRNLKTRLTYEATVAEWWPVWTPDGRSIAYSEEWRGRGDHGIRMLRADGSGDHETLTDTRQSADRDKQGWQLPMTFSRDAKYLVYQDLRTDTAADIWILPFAPRGQPQPFLKTPFYEGLPAFSPNGRWIAYVSNESGHFEIYVRPYPGPGPKYQISGDQTFDLHFWSNDGKKLFYRSGDGSRMMSVPVRTDGPVFEFGKPEVLFELNAERYPDLSFWGSFAAAPDGSGFALVKLLQPESGARTHLMLMTDWR